jgi:hypothetical protein
LFIAICIANSTATYKTVEVAIVAKVIGLFLLK